PAQDDGGPVAVSPQGSVLEAAENEAPPPSASARAGPTLGAHERADIPAGAFTAGSMPGDRGRGPVLEPPILKIELGGFAIDRHLYPNDPQQAPMTGVPRARAAELCGRAGARLCTDLEWERACKGPDAAAYAGSPAWDPTCAKEPTRCASGFGVF